MIRSNGASSFGFPGAAAPGVTGSTVATLLLFPFFPFIPPDGSPACASSYSTSISSPSAAKVFPRIRAFPFRIYVRVLGSLGGSTLSGSPGSRDGGLIISSASTTLLITIFTGFRGFNGAGPGTPANVAGRVGTAVTAGVPSFFFSTLSFTALITSLLSSPIASFASRAMSFNASKGSAPPSFFNPSTAFFKSFASFIPPLSFSFTSRSASFFNASFVVAASSTIFIAFFRPSLLRASCFTVFNALNSLLCVGTTGSTEAFFCAITTGAPAASTAIIK